MMRLSKRQKNIIKSGKTSKNLKNDNDDRG